VAFNAAGFTDDLVDAELFGHTKGAFTGAFAAREGYVAAAEGGTLFIDEVAEMTPRVQAKLLRFLEERRYQRLGETTVRRADVRVLSATNADLSRRAREGRFRNDLLWRLQDARLVLPPLRERGEDVLLLARHFLGLEAAEGRRPVPELTPEVERVLARHPWPGNVRQLRSEMRRLVVVAGGGRVFPEHLSPELLETAEGERPALLKARLDDVEREHLREALRRNGGVRARAAADLGITRQALWSKLRRLKVEPGEARGSLGANP
jgi:NtrC-family two-component system response regulator AlgB